MNNKRAAIVGGKIVFATVLLATLSAPLNAKPAKAAKEEGTAEQRAACTPDVFRFCTEFIPNHEMIANCLRHNLYRLNKLCRKVFE
jgi:hypothetical protein